MPRCKQDTYVRRRPLHGKTCSGTTQASWIPSWAACLAVCPSISPINWQSEHLFHGTHVNTVPTPPENVLTRAGRAYWRLSWEQRLTRNVRATNAPPLLVTLHGLPATFAQSFGFHLLA